MSSRSTRFTDHPAAAGRTFHLESLGCAKNQVDSELMIAALQKAGWERASGPAAADVLIVNTCGFITEAKTQSIETSLSLKAQHPGKIVIMAGCLSERYRDTLARELPEIDGFLGNRDPADIVALLEGRPLAKPASAAHLASPVGPAAPARPYERPHLLSFPGSAYVKIAEGCANRCTYCAIPLIRGELASRDRAEIVAEIRGLRDRGIKELILIAQDLGSYGKDRGRAELVPLLSDIASLSGDFWVRLLYIHPDHFPEGLLDVVSADARFLPYFDLPFQHAAPGILRAMGRRGDPERNLALVSEIRGRLPLAAIRSTFLLGFPGETDADFADLLDFQDKARLDWVGAFTYSREEDTPAYSMAGKVTKAAAARRKAELETRQVPITERALDARVGTTLDVLVEEQVEGEDMSIGRGYLQAPDVDGLVVLMRRLPPGTTARAHHAEKRRGPGGRECLLRVDRPKTARRRIRQILRGTRPISRCSIPSRGKPWCTRGRLC
jgi:ribosomal protein S12 methylthiotransferase